ncbi:hypothetical protein H6P81_019402 [Aristolochia fimbriata]|uniref:Uncharacterized protein n=1 Tax=Aristolochia fimbriata TaxID=158543 RepID=A0AAV7DRQ6_ARIFI|nr:hypothetical protein H6P81_019402 [Aristolochia fimbriata]
MGDEYYGFYGGGKNSRSGVVSDDDFEEEDIWAAAVGKEKKDNSPKMRKPKESPVSPVPRHLPSAARMIPRSSQNSINEGTAVRAVRQSAPVNIPDWSKIYGNKSCSDGYLSGEGSWRGRGRDYGRGDNDDGAGGFEDEEEEEEEEEGRIPPHEWIARKLARSQISSFSVCEGAGRTLKGRDLSKEFVAVLKLLLLRYQNGTHSFHLYFSDSLRSLAYSSVDCCSSSAVCSRSFKD